MAADLDERLAIGAAVRTAIACLPEGWDMQIDLSRGGAEVILFPPDVEGTRYFDDPQRPLSARIRDALAHAIGDQPCPTQP